METQTSDDEFFFLFLKFSVVPKKSTPGKFAHFWHLSELEQTRKKFEKNANSFSKV